MDFNKKQTLVYARGFITNFVEQYAESLPENAPKHIIEQSAQLTDMWNRISAGLTELMNESDNQQLKLSMVQQALETPDI